MDKKLQKGMIDLAELLLVGFMAVLIVACITTLETIRQDQAESNPHLDPLVKQEIREAVKDGIQADRDEKLQQLRNLPDESVKARFVHF
jgi:hypothetical protein